jgi:phage terminase large subunit-like protein
LDNREPWRLEPFQAAFVKDWLRASPQSECWLLVPEGNGKTTLVAGLALYHAQFTPEAWVPVAASSRDQARTLYRQARGFVMRSDSLSEFRCFDGYRRIDLRAIGSQIEVFASDDRTGDGVLPTLAILDELHRHKSLALYQTWRGKLEKRGGKLIAISTAGEPGSEFEETRERIRQEAPVVERKETFVRAKHPRLVFHEWAVPEDGDVKDFALVARANPYSKVTRATLKDKFSSPTLTLGHWKRFTCNIATRSEYAAITEQEWFQARTDTVIPAGEPVSVGLDVGWKYDTTAVVPLWVRDPEFRLLGSARIVVPPRDGNQLHPDQVKRPLVEIHERNPVRLVVMDMKAAEDIAAWIEDELGCRVVDRTQGNAMQVVDYDRFMAALRNGWLHHSGDPGLSRHALNAIARVLPQGDTRFDRPHASRFGSQRGREIDALVAAAMVHTVACKQTVSVYETRGVFSV